MQPPQESLTTPRRPLDVEDYIDIVRRHKNWLIGPTFLGLVVSVVVAFLWPNTYISEAAIQVLPPQVPDKLVPTNVGTEMSQRINTIAGEILSRPSLTNIISTFGLYKDQLKRKPMEDVIEEMRGRRIRISPVLRMEGGPGGRGRELSAFRVAFEYENRVLAQKVTADLTSRFISENIRWRASQSEQTTVFLKEQLDAARKDLAALESKVTDFRVRNTGKLPDQLQQNLQAMRALETQLTGANEAISRIGQNRLLIEGQLRIYREQLASIQSASDPLGAAAKSERLVGLEREILKMETAISAMLERYSPSHPDVKRAQSQLDVFKRTRDNLLKQEKDSKEKAAETPGPQPVTPLQFKTVRELEAAISRGQSQVEALNMEEERRTKEQQHFNQMLKSYQARIESSPLVEQQYAEMTRDLELAKARYDDLNRRASQSAMGTELERGQQSETLALLEPASLPERPEKPNRWLIVGVGAALGAMLGIFTTGAREMKDTSLKSLKDARAYTNLPVLGTIPLLQNDLVVRRKRRLAWLAWSAAMLIGLLAMSSSVYYYYATRV